MEQDLATDEHSSTNDHFSNIREQSNEMKDFVFKHLQVVTEQSNGSLPCKPDEYSIEETPPLTHKNQKVKSCRNAQGAVFTGNILSFSCSMCKDNFTYSPNDLLKHFKETHKDGLPSYPCDLCGFVTNEFSDLQRHRIGHRNTLVACEICDNNVQYSLLMLTRHYIMCHSLNGRFQCEKCEFKTLDAGTYVQHIHHHNEGRFKCFKCPHVSSSKDEHQRHSTVHGSKLSFNCQICGYVADRIEYLKQHMVNAHGEDTGDRITAQRAQDDDATPNSTATLKLLLKEDAKCSRRISKRNCVSGNLPNNVSLSKSERSSEETLWFDGKMAVKKHRNGSQSCQTAEQQTACELTPPVQLIIPDTENSSEMSQSNPNGLTVLKLKNKISIPPNCTTKVIGFKVVDGKKHLVLKVLPVTKVESPTIDLSQTKDFVGHRKCNSDVLPCTRFTGSQSASAHVFQDDIVAVKVKVEEEEMPLSGSSPVSQKDDYKEQAEIEDNTSIAQSSKKYSAENKTDRVKEKINKDFNSITVNSNPDLIPLCKSTQKIHNTSLLSSIKVDLPPDKNKRLLDAATNQLVTELSKNNPDLNIGGEVISLTIGNEQLSKGNQNCTKKPSESAMPLAEINSSPSYSRESIILSENSLTNPPNEEVFSFHNYSKESLNISPHSMKPFDNQTETWHAHESSQYSIKLSESPRPSSKCWHGSNAHLLMNHPPHRESIEPNSDIDELGQCKFNTDEHTTDENSESIFQDFNIIKVEEENVPVSKTQQESSSAHLGHEKSILVVKQHSDAIINHQLNKERVGTCGDSGNPAKTTLRIFQIPEGKQQMLLQTAENKYAIPVQLKGNTGFKLITKSSSPRVNVSYLKPRFDCPSNPTSLVHSQNGEAGMEKPFLRPCKTGITSVSAVQPNVGTIPNHFLCNSTGLNGPFLVSKTGQGTPVEKTCVKRQQACYFVQRSLPIVKPPSNAGLRVASSQVPLCSRPILAMPLSPAINSSILPTGRQAYLVRYVSQAKSGNILSNIEGQTGTQSKQNSESTGSKVLYRIVTPTSGLFASIVPMAADEPLFLAPRSRRDPSFLVSKKTNDATVPGVKNGFPVERAPPEHDVVSGIFHSHSNFQVLENPWPIRPPSQRKRRRKPLFDEIPMHKARRLANKTPTTGVCNPVTKDMERTLRLYPFSSLQQVKCPRRLQPVVVLNHPDADIPEVASIMKSVNRYRGAVTKVSLSCQTVEAISVLNQKGLPGTKPLPPASNGSKLHPDPNSVRERFLLKLKLKKKGRRKYEVVKTLSRCAEQPMFDCWFCGRLFNSQEDWVCHGQRHLMEATRDWNKLF